MKRLTTTYLGALATLSAGVFFLLAGSVAASPPPGTSDAYAINNGGQVVGYSILANGETHAFLWQNGKMTDINPSGASNSDAFGINDSGQIVGFSDRDGPIHAILWQGKKVTDIGPPGSDDTEAYAINNRGQAVGNDLFDGGFLWQRGELTSLGQLGPVGINERGQVVGFGAESRAFLWQNGVITDLTPPGSDFSFVHGINNRGQVVGNGSSGAFLWEKGKFANLGDFFPMGINDGGQVVGESGTSGVAHAVLWQKGVTTDLNPPDWDYSVANAINNRGQIVGVGAKGGESHAFLWQNGVMTDLGALAG